MAETTQVDTVESASPIPPVDAPVEKSENVNGGDHKLENGGGDAVTEEPNAASTPVKDKAKRRQIVSNMRAAFARLDLMGQLRTLGRRMRRPTQKKKEEQAAEAKEGEAKPAVTEGETIPSATPAANGEAKQEKAGEEEEKVTANGVEPVAAEAGEVQPSTTASNEPAAAEPTAVVAQ